MSAAKRLAAAGVEARACASAGCGRPMFLVTNAETGKSGPVDPAAVVWVVHRPTEDGAPPRAVTAGKFIESIEGVILKDGTLISPDDLLGFFVSHFATCPDAPRFSGGGRGRKP